MILDEAKLLDTSFEIKLDVDQLRRFDQGLHEAAEREPRAATMIARWRDSIRTLLATNDETVRDKGWQFPGGLQRYAAQIQKIGLQLDGTRYRYLAYDLQLFAGSRTDERWRDANGAIRFIARPYLGNDLLVLSGHLKSTYVTARLGLTTPIASPFETMRFQHTGTRVYNLRSRIGAEKYFPKNRVQILDLLAVLIFRNISLGRSTVLVTRKKFKESCAKELTERLNQLDLDVAFETELAPHHIHPDPRILPMLHYGVRGMNRYQEYDACYCVSSYFVPASAVSEALQDEVPDRYRVQLAIRTDENATRRAVVLDEAYVGAGIDVIAQSYLHKLEIEPALQAAGRVRFFTRPREVLFMQLADLSPDVPGVRDVRSLEQLREHLEVPTAGDLRRAFEVRALREHVDRGASVRQAAEAIGLDKETARRRLSDERLNGPLSFLKRYSEPLPGASA